VDDLLEQMKAKQGGGTSTSAGTGRRKGKRKSKSEDRTIDEELAALKRKMAAKKKGR
jgi:hypothetical protein